jgi:hypothetical protein
MSYGDPMHAGDGDHGHLAQSSTPGRAAPGRRTTALGH